MFTFCFCLLFSDSCGKSFHKVFVELVANNRINPDLICTFLIDLLKNDLALQKFQAELSSGNINFQQLSQLWCRIIASPQIPENQINLFSRYIAILLPEPNLKDSSAIDIFNTYLNHLCEQFCKADEYEKKAKIKEEAVKCFNELLTGSENCLKKDSSYLKYLFVIELLALAANKCIHLIYIRGKGDSFLLSIISFIINALQSNNQLKAKAMKQNLQMVIKSVQTFYTFSNITI